MNTFWILFLAGIGFTLSSTGSAGKTIPASDATFLGSVLDETWDVSHAAESGHIDSVLPLSDVDLTVTLAAPGPVTLHFDPRVYDPGQNPATGPRWIAEVDGVEEKTIVTIGPSAPAISTFDLTPGRHRIRFVEAGIGSGSPRWAPGDPQFSRVTGVTIPDGATLGPSQRAASWFLPIADSIGEGYHGINTTKSREGTGAYTDTNRAWPAVLGRLMKKSIAGYLISGIGVVHAGVGVPHGALNADDPSGKSDSWDHIFAGVARPFTTAPDFILLCVGTNELATDVNVVGPAKTPDHPGGPDPSSTDANFQANLETFFTRVRAKPQLAVTPILVSVPFGGYKRTAIQKAVAAYKAAHPSEAHLAVFDLAHGSPALTTTDGIDEITLFDGLTGIIHGDTIPSPQAPDRCHPYAIATPAIGSVDASAQMGQVMAARLTAFLRNGTVPATGNLTAGKLSVTTTSGKTILASGRATGGSTPYTYRFQKSTDGGKTWTALGQPIDNQAAAMHAIQVEDTAGTHTTSYRIAVTDIAEPSAVAYGYPTRTGN
jgi:lysophospholipase L1-like esterase